MDKDPYTTKTTRSRYSSPILGYNDVSYFLEWEMVICVFTFCLNSQLKKMRSDNRRLSVASDPQSVQVIE